MVGTESPAILIIVYYFSTTTLKADLSSLDVLLIFIPRRFRV
jgi:hypothetical protein